MGSETIDKPLTSPGLMFPFNVKGRGLPPFFFLELVRGQT